MTPARRRIRSGTRTGTAKGGRTVTPRDAPTTTTRRDDVGTQLLRIVEAHPKLLGSLSANARTALYVMALNAHDNGTNDAPPRTYFRGWDHLARAALGREEYDHAAELAVGRVIRELTDAGLIVTAGRRNGKPTGRVLYRLTLPL